MLLKTAWDRPSDLKSCQNKKDGKNFDDLSPSYKRQYVGWIVAAKQEKTRRKRIKESIALLEKGEKLGMK